MSVLYLKKMQITMKNDLVYSTVNNLQALVHTTHITT